MGRAIHLKQLRAVVRQMQVPERQLVATSGVLRAAFHPGTLVNAPSTQRGRYRKLKRAFKEANHG